MRNMCLGITAFVVTVGMVSVGAQGRNFSGTWIIDSEKTQAAALASAEQPTRAMVTRSAGGDGGAARGTGGAVASAGTGGGGGGVAVGGVMTAGAGGGGRARGTGSGEGAVAAAPTERRVAGGVMLGAGGGGRGGATDMVITSDGSTFTIDNGGIVTSYPTNGSETTIQLRSGATAKARASWKGDTLIIEETRDTPDGAMTNTTSWFLEGDSLVRLTTRRTYFKKK